jgi:hypothetical protein
MNTDKKKSVKICVHPCPIFRLLVERRTEKDRLRGRPSAVKSNDKISWFFHVVSGIVTACFGQAAARRLAVYYGFSA